MTDGLASPVAKMTDVAGRHLAIYFPRLAGGGAERLYLNLAPEFLAAGLRVTILLDRNIGELADSAVPPGITIETLGASRTLTAFPRLIQYLRRAKPDILLSALSVNNAVVLLARMLAGRQARRRTRIIVSQHNTLSAEVKLNAAFSLLPLLYRMLFGFADAIVAVSKGVSADLARCAGLAEARIQVIHNGVVDAGFAERALAPCVHSWYSDADVRVFVALGRLNAQKDFSTLLRGFAAMPANAQARLIVLGEGPLRGALVAEASALGISQHVDFPGYVHQPLPYIAQAHALVLSSRYEGFGLVLAEALACGTQVVSTDCPHGPSEILDGGKFGTLVAVGDPRALAAAMTASLSSVPDRARLMSRGQVFSIQNCADAYLRLFATLTSVPHEHDEQLPKSIHERTTRNYIQASAALRG